MPAVSRSASHFRPRPDKRPWDTLVVAEQRATRKALAALAGYGEFRDSGYPCVLVGARSESGGVSLVEPAVLEAIAPLVQRIFLAEGSREFERDDVTETLCEVLEGEAPRLAGRSFYVRANLRGMKGRLEHPAVERALGAFLWERTEAAGNAATVSFKDPDVIVAAEVVGSRVAWALVDRERRASALFRVR
jgi:tRNA(Ser,Leu) C12 N-acetylase TAN1